MRILYVEDDRLDADLARVEFTRSGADFELTVVPTLQRAWEQLAEPARFDIIVVDLNLPDGSGIELVAEARERGLELPIVMLTGSGDERSAVAALKTGADDYLVKRGDYLQQLPQVLASAHAAFRRGIARRSRPLRVLYAEHYALDVELTLRHLARHAGHIRVDVVDSANVVLQRLRETPEAQDVLMLDYRLLGMNAIELLRILCADGNPPPLPVVLVTGQGDEAIAVEALRLGAADYLVKRPGYLHEIPSTLENAFNRGLLVREQAALRASEAVRRSREEALRASEERFRQIAENIHEVFWMTDPDRHTMLYVSPAYETIWGRPCAAIMERPSDWLKAIHPDDRARISVAAKKQMRGDYHETYRVVRPDGTTRWVRDRAFPIRDEQGQVYRIVGTAEDITEHRKLEEQFIQAQKMEAIGTLAGGIAHDFNNILAAITGYTELLRMQLKDSVACTPYIDALMQASDRAALLVRQILTFSRQGEHMRKPVRLENVVEEPLTLLRATIPATITFDVELARDLPPVMADATQIHQLVMNLCTNASHSMRDGVGRLSVRLEQREVTPAMARELVRLHAGPHLVLSVSDTGCGMTREVQERIFEPFFTTKGPGEGTGLGLAVVHGVMETHEGAVTVRSAPGEGTTFELYFPVTTDFAHGSANGTRPTEIVRGRGERVLIVDDEPPIMLVGRLMLEELGYRVESSTEVMAMLELFRSKPTEFDLVISDVSMPAMSGADFARRVLAIRPDVPVLLMTGYNATLTEERVREMGVRELIMKPLSMESLAAAVQRALHGGGASALS